MGRLNEVRLLTVEQVAELLGLKKARICDAIRSDVFPHVKVGRQVYVNEAALEQWIEAGGAALALKRLEAHLNGNGMAVAL